MSNYRKKLKKVKAFVFDVDGVLGSDKVLLFSDGEMLRTMNIKDGYAMQYAVRKGYKIAIITGGSSDSVRKRFEKLGIDDVYILSRNKIDDYEHFLNRYKLTDEEVLYMGDDLPDYRVMKKVGVPTFSIARSPADCSEGSIARWPQSDKGLGVRGWGLGGQVPRVRLQGEERFSLAPGP